MDSRPIYFVIYYKSVATGRWRPYSNREFAHRHSAEQFKIELQREQPKRIFGVRQKRWSGRVHQEAVAS